MENSEVCYVFEGEGVLYIDDIPVDLEEGQLVYIPENSI